MESWKPRTKLGRDVANGLVTLDQIFSNGQKILESEIIDHLLPGIKSDIIFIGGSPGKGGGSRRTPTKRTARMHRSGRRYRISAMSIVGNENGYVGIGIAKSKEHRDAIQKSAQKAKLNIIPVKRGCGSWECGCGGDHSIPYTVEGKSGSVRIMLLPAPKGIGLCIGNEAKKVMKLVGIKDIWVKCFGDTRSRDNYMKALFNAFKKINQMKGDVRQIATPVPAVAQETVADEEEQPADSGEVAGEIKELKKTTKKLVKKEKALKEKADDNGA